jgi:hypothetical protein
MAQLTIAKATEQDIDATRHFLQMCEAFWDNRNRYSLRELESDWENWDDDDPDKIEMLRIQRNIADEEGKNIKCIDNRLIVYEFLKCKYKKADNKWGRVIMAADVLIDNCCDPTERHLAFHPSFETFHVAPEQ